MPTVAAPAPADCDKAVAHVIKWYISEGPLKADDLLDEMSIESDSTVALRFMMEFELNPGGALRAPEYKPARSKLVNVVCLTAKAMDLQNKLPLQARKFAHITLSLIGDESMKSTFPENWAVDLKAIGQSAVDPKRTTDSKSISTSKSISEALLEIKQNDPKAPAVMSDSILSMIGMDAVKESMIGMYHRFKLAQGKWPLLDFLELTVRVFVSHTTP